MLKRSLFQPSATLACGLIAAWTVVNVIYLLFACPHDLAPDEAHYWDWSRQLDFSYYSKGPMIALLIRASCELLGTTAFAVRLPAVICGSLILLGLYRITRTIRPDDRTPAIATILVAVSLPAFTALSLISTIDPPFLCFWTWATVCIGRVHRSNRYWIVAGILVAHGLLTKMTMILFPFCVGLMLCFAKQQLRLFWFIVFVIISTIGLIPVIHWNLNHQNVGLLHLTGQSGLYQEWPGVLGLLGFIGHQLSLLLGVWFFIWLATIWSYRHTPGLSRLWWLSVPVVVTFWIVSVFAVGQPNWAAPAYLAGLPMMVIWVYDRWHNRHIRRAVIGVAIVGLMLGLVLRWPGLIRPVLVAIGPSVSEQNPMPLRRLDPSARLSGWNHLAREVDDVRRQIRDQGNDDPCIVGMTWIIPGELSFYCENHPRCYSFGSVVGDRISQYDIWRPNPVHDPGKYKNSTFIYIGDKLPEGVFTHSEKVRQFVHHEAGSPIAMWGIWICRGYQGFDLSRIPWKY